MGQTLASPRLGGGTRREQKAHTGISGQEACCGYCQAFTVFLVQPLATSKSSRLPTSSPYGKLQHSRHFIYCDFLKPSSLQHISRLALSCNTTLSQAR